ncbi:hypothetical protein BIY27_02885 [Gibbsiella quercinecans]|uniref:restriction endonuclease subunit S n=1 Tax=Gibbsiella quercinecans TaxID=929813 RepID=UPI000F227EB8|nr:restriction endonuclease subunit S [Gibbsiella quercinecans]RLM16293.1 hypothetical protein BIY27_02885 [Gibbsiella quercinecans]
MPLKTEALASMCEAVVDCPHSTPVWTDSGYVVLRNQNIKDGRLDLSEPSFTDEEHFKHRIRRMAPRPGDIVITREAPMGEVCKVPEGLTCCLGQRQVLLRPKADVDTDYLLYALQSPFVQNQIRWNEGTGSTVSNIRIPVLEKIEIPRLDRAETSIAQTLSSLDSKIDLNRRINQTLETMAQVIFKSWFVDFDPVKAKIAAFEQGEHPLHAAMRAISGKTDAELDQMPREHHDQLATIAALFPDEMEESELGEIPKGWAVNTLGSVTNYLSRGISPKYLENGGVLVLNQKCIRDFRVDVSKGRRHDPTQRKIDGRALELGDVLVNSTGVGTLGRVAQVLCLNEPTIVDSHVTVVRASHELNASYLGQYIIWKQPNIETMGEGSTGQTELSRAKLAELPVLTPRENVLKVFDNLISPLNNEISANDRESVKLAKLRDTLLPKLLSGELSVSDVGKLADTTGAA